MTKTNKQKNRVVKVPLRRDLVSREMFDKRELVRIVVDKEKNISLDPTGKKNGRGAYIRLDVDSANTLKTRKLLNKEFDLDVSDDFYQEIIDYVTYQISRKELLDNQPIVKKQNP